MELNLLHACVHVCVWVCVWACFWNEKRVIHCAYVGHPSPSPQTPKKHKSDDSLTRKHPLSVWPFPAHYTRADSNVPWADKLYQPTHLSVPTITHVRSDSHRHVAFFAFSLTRSTPASAVHACVCVCTHVLVRKPYKKGPEETTIHSWLEYMTHTIAHLPTQDCKYSGST